LDPNILFSILFSNTHSWCSFLNVRDQISHPYRNYKKKYNLVRFNFYVLDSRTRRQKVLNWMVVSTTHI
jgi:hypothetical protein